MTVAKKRNKMPSFHPGDLVQTFPPPISGEEGWLAPTGPCLVLRTHRTVLRSGWEGQEIWVLVEGKEKKFFSDQLMWVDSIEGPR
jgi:hypothetical protein